ncbi:reverse transcriptase [Gossypium australe]|uniref:Reverse transcriptase n=1 Tax=Gossypium australe TaxID=47621 RepID=A0A5B6VAY2_9ROSI|nr:reverse transcriptase [Gossypium australe]
MGRRRDLETEQSKGECEQNKGINAEKQKHISRGRPNLNKGLQLDTVKRSSGPLATKISASINESVDRHLNNNCNGSAVEGLSASKPVDDPMRKAMVQPNYVVGPIGTIKDQHINETVSSSGHLSITAFNDMSDNNTILLHENSSNLTHLNNSCLNPIFDNQEENGDNAHLMTSKSVSTLSIMV